MEPKSPSAAGLADYERHAYPYQNKSVYAIDACRHGYDIYEAFTAFWGPAAAQKGFTSTLYLSHGWLYFGFLPDFFFRVFGQGDGHFFLISMIPSIGILTPLSWAFFHGWL